MIDAVTAVIEEVEGVRLLAVAPGGDTNRTAITFLGLLDGVARFGGRGGIGVRLHVQKTGL